MTAAILSSQMCRSVVHFISPLPYHQFLTKLTSRSITLNYAARSSLHGYVRNAFAKPSLRTILLMRPVVNGFNGVTHRLFSTSCRRTVKRPQRSWEVDGAVLKDTLIYSYKNDRYYRMITIFGFTQLLFWGNLALFSYSGLSNLDENKLKSSFQGSPFWGSLLEFQVKHKYRIAVFCVAVGYAVMFFTWMYPQRSIRKLILLAGGENLRVTTYTHLGKTRDFEVPLSLMTSNQTRTADQPSMSFKIKGHWFYYILDKQNGEFHNPVLFDNVVNLKRDSK